MEVLSLTELNKLLTFSGKTELYGLGLELLEAFEERDLLSKDAFERWMAKSGRKPWDVIAGAQCAVDVGWLDDTADGLQITDKGKSTLPQPRRQQRRTLRRARSQLEEGEFSVAKDQRRRNSLSRLLDLACRWTADRA
jgi:hypothetical protein